MTDTVAYKHEDGLATITLDDGRANALSPAVIAALDAAIGRAEADDAALLLTGRPGMFCAGFDLKTMQAGGQPASDMVVDGFRLARRLLAHRRPVVVACSGHVMAMGVFLMLCADYIMAAEGEFKVAANEVAIGLTMPHSALVLSRGRLTSAAHYRAMGTSEFYTPATGVPAGFMDELVEPASLADRATEKLRSLADLPRDIFAATKSRLTAERLAALDEAIDADRREFDALFTG
ncbi:MAG: enoyl-CoA hydratase [Salinisphaeraceae bacterium]|jgi:enoyl-CoA hydratase|nr:enoyl-CoA hydratase [Salinisphaeraceae bacterium]